MGDDVHTHLLMTEKFETVEDFQNSDGAKQAALLDWLSNGIGSKPRPANGTFPTAAELGSLRYLAMVYGAVNKVGMREADGAEDDGNYNGASSGSG